VCVREGVCDQERESAWSEGMSDREGVFKWSPGMCDREGVCIGLKG
jgi:hypothetical protein